MGKEKFVDSSLLDKAIKFAVDAHKNVERRGKGVPYIVHPIEVVAIVSTMTTDQELLAAAALHDVVEDTDITAEEIEKEFNKRIADLVRSESDAVFVGQSETQSWKIRKKMAIDRLAKASKESKMVALGDKLSNMRAIYYDYNTIGNKIWTRFHETDPKMHEWHYRGLASSLSELNNFEAYKEFTDLIDKVFSSLPMEFSVNVRGENVIVTGDINLENSLLIEKELTANRFYNLDFKNVTSINFAGLRTLYRLKENGIHFVISRVNKKVMHQFDNTGVSSLLSVTEEPQEYDANTLTQSGDGFTALTYFTPDHDEMVKIYHDFVPLESVQKEKRMAAAVLKLGLPTPLSGNLIKVGNKNGIIFERVMDKISYARAISMNPNKIEELAKDFASMALKLHSTKCDTTVFPDVKEGYYNSLNRAKGIDEKGRNIAKEFIDNVPNVITCVHGDFHMGNVIKTNKGEKLFIDLSDFSYGHPYFDIGTLYFTCHCKDEKLTERLYHCSNQQLLDFWKYFVKYYFKVEQKENIDKIEQTIKPYAALKIIDFLSKGGGDPWMFDCLKEWLY